MDARERAELFEETAARKNLAQAIIEKDFWVCWVLKQLFSNKAFEGRLLFKGGTSLSKIFHAINRFSEDIDLAVDYIALGFTGDKDPRKGTCRDYIAGEFLESFRQQCAAILGAGDAWGLDVSKTYPNVVEFRYPTAGTKGLEYVNPRVVLELGTHAEFVPHGQFSIRSFASEEFPNVVKDRDISVTALLAKRTFWEKATILHAEYHRPAEKPLPERYSRHYYDVAMMGEGKIKGEALTDRDLLAQVVKHKETFYASGWARYDLARPGTLRLVPQESRVAALEQDYKKMGVMIFGEQPPFAWVLDRLGVLEKEINK
jgi:hypothetical protein